MIIQSKHLNPKIGKPDVELQATRLGYGQGLVELGKKDERIVVLTGDLAESTTADKFQKEFPERFIECGVAEQNMMGLAAGLALAGKIPFISSYAVFSPGRSWDQLRVSVCYSEANVKVAGAHTGISVGPDGATHQALEDIAITRVLPNLTVVAPCDYIETRKATIALGTHVGPAYFRFGRNKTGVITNEHTPFEVGKANILQAGTDVALIGCGPVLYNGLLAARMLKDKGVSVMVVNNHTIKPLDEATIIAAAKKCGVVVTLEEHQIMGGMGSAVAELLAEKYPIPVIRMGIRDRFGESGQPEELLEAFGLGMSKIQETLHKAVKLK